MLRRTLALAVAGALISLISLVAQLNASTDGFDAFAIAVLAWAVGPYLLVVLVADAARSGLVARFLPAALLVYTIVMYAIAPVIARSDAQGGLFYLFIPVPPYGLLVAAALSGQRPRRSDPPAVPPPAT